MKLSKAQERALAYLQEAGHIEFIQNLRYRKQEWKAKGVVRYRPHRTTFLILFEAGLVKREVNQYIYINKERYTLP